MDQADTEPNEESDATHDPATLAFEALRGEVTALRATVSELKAPDYAPTLGVMTKSLHAIEQRLGTIEGHPALKSTPEQQRRVLVEAGSDLMRLAVESLEKDSRRLGSHAEQLSRLIGEVRDRRQQRNWLLGAVAGGLVAGLLVFPWIASALPFGWDSALAVSILGERDRWTAGWALVKADNPEGWEAAAKDWNLIAANKDTLASCREAVSKARKAQKCTISVGVE